MTGEKEDWRCEMVYNKHGLEACACLRNVYKHQTFRMIL